MKTKRKRGKALLSVLLILSMLLSYAPPGGIVYAAPLTHADTVYDQKVFGFTYTENGATRNMYLYQSEDGKVKLTGDILFTTSSYGYYQVRHYDGYLELQNLEGLQIKQAILIQHGNLYTGDSEKANKHEAFFDLRILDENGDLWSFNAASNEMLTQLNFTNDYWDPQVIPITKIEDIFYLDEYGNLGAISPESAIAHNYKIENEHYGTKIHKYWHIDEHLTNDVKDFLIVAPSTTPEEEFADPRYYRISENTQLYIQHTDDSQEIKAVKFVNDYLYDDYVTGYHYELSDSSLSVPVIDNGTNTLTVDGIAQGIDENWFYLQIDDENEVCLNSEDPTETTDTTKTYSVMDGHVTITLTKKTAESTTYNKFAVQSDSTDTIEFDSTTNTIITGYQDIKIYSTSKPDAVIHEATKPIGYHESWSQSYGEESTTSTSIQNDSLTELLSMAGTKGYGEKNYDESSAGYAGQEAHHFSKKWINQNIVSYSITNERAANGTYYYDMDVQILGNHAVNNVGTTYPGFVFDTNDGHYAGTAGNYMIGDGLISCYKIKDFTFSTTKDGNCYNHVLDFNHNKHYIYKNHYKMAEYPMNFKDGETDTPYVYSEEEWQFAVYPKLDEDLNIWEAVVEFAYADNAPTTGADYPNINVKMSSTIALRKQLVNNGDDTYSRPNFTDEYNVFKSATIKSIQIGDTLIEGSSLGSLDAGNTPVYEMSGGKCVYRATNYKDNRITYDVMEDGSFYQGINGHSLVAKNVVKVDSSGNYLSDEGELFDFDGNKLHDNVINITDNLYQTEDGTWRYLSSDEEFHLDAADEHNLMVHHQYSTGYKEIKYTFEYNEDEITSVVDEKGTAVANGDTRSYRQNGTHEFTITNKYGDTYTKRIIVTGFYGSDTLQANISAVNDEITLTGPEDAAIEYKKIDEEEWHDYEEPFEYDGTFLYRTNTNKSGTITMSATIDNETGKLTVTDLSEGTLNSNDYYVNAVWDGTTMHYYDTDNNRFQDGIIRYMYQTVHNAGGEQWTSNNDDNNNRYILTNGYPDENSGMGVKPIYGFVGPQLPADAFVPVTGRNDGDNTYANFQNKTNKNYNVIFITNEDDINTARELFQNNWRDYTTIGNNGFKFFYDFDFEFGKKDLDYAGIAYTEADEDDINKAYLGNFSILAGNAPQTSDISPKSEDVLDGDVSLEPVLDTNHMLNFYNNTTNQDTTFVKAFMDGAYNWLVTDTGQLLRSVANWIIGTQGRAWYDSFTLEEVADDITSVDENYMVSSVSGDNVSFGYAKDNVKYYLQSDIEANGGNIDGAQESGDIIVASSGTGANKRALASNGNYYVAVGDNAMVSYDRVIPAVNQLDYEVSTIRWTNELVNITPRIGAQFNQEAPDGTSYTICKINDDEEEYLSIVDIGDPDDPDDDSTDIAHFNTGDASSPVYNGSYRIDLIDNATGTILKSQNVILNNIDTVKPSINIADEANGVYTFAGQDENGTYETDNDNLAMFNGVDSAVSGIESLYYSLDNTTDPTTWTVLDKPVKYTPEGTASGDVIEVDSKTIYVYAKDKAGNMSDVKTFNIGIELTPTVTYENGHTDLTFYADEDVNHDTDNYTYSYTVGDTDTDGYESSFTEDTDVVLHSTHTIPEEANRVITASRDVPIIVLKPGKPTISDIDTSTRSVTVTAGTPAHMAFKELWVKVDDGEFTKYTNQTKVITFTDYGYHTIKAYQVAENTELAGGPYTFQGEEVEKTVEDPEPVTIHHTYQYEKGKTTVTFYANEDTNNDDDRWTYKYTVAGGTQQDGYTFEVTEDTTAELFAEVDNGGLKSNGTKNINIYVMDAEKPQISDVPKNGNKSTITAGEIENDTLKTLEYKIDDATTYTTINSGDEVEVPVGWHTIYAKQTTNGNIVTENERRVYVADLDITHKIKHHNGYTELTFEDKDPEKNPDLTYTHDDIPGNGVVTDTPITVHIKETDPQGNDDEDTVDLDIVKTDAPTISVENDKLKLVAGDIENGTLIKMYYSFDNQNFEPYETPVDLDMDDVTVYTYQTVKPDTQFDDNDIVTSDTAQADIFKYDVEFVDDEGTVIADGYSHVVLAGTSVTENAKAIDKFAPREPSITKVVDEPGIVLSFVYDGNPVDVTIYHLDAENNNTELARDTLSQQALRSVITATERKKSFVGYTYKNADPATLVVTNDTKEMRLYYEYASFDYVVHYVDKDGRSVAPDKQASAKFRANVTETAIEIANYELDDDAQKEITIKADSPNEITFKYKKVIPPRSATISGRVTDDDGEAVVNGTVTLTKKKGLIDGILSLFNDDAPKTAKTDANGNYDFANVETGEYKLAVSDDTDKSLAKATITVSKTGEEANDEIEVTFKGDHVTTHDAIEGNNFIVNVGQTSIPVTVTVYHLDMMNNNIELAKEELPDVELNSIVKSSEHVKAFTGYVFKNADPEALTVTKTAKEMRLYYEYDSFDYIVHYVDESNHPLAPDKTGNALFKSLVTERAIPIENYEPADVTEKSITIEANVRNEITFVYKKTIAPRSATVSGHVTDDDGEPVVGGIVTLTQHTGLVEDVLTPISGVANETTTNAEGYYEFTNVPAGEHELEVSDPEQTSLAKATINVSKTGEEVTDNIEITFRGDHVTTHDAINGNNFIVNVGQTSRPVTVTVYHLDAENNNAELDKDEISNTEIGTIINADDHIKQFEGYTFRDADPETLTVTKTNKEIRLYYIYDEFDYTVHYVDEEDEPIAEDKTGKALFNSEVIEQAIEVEGYELNDDKEKSIIIKADKPNEITFKYKAVEEEPRAVSIVGQAKDKGTTPIVNRVVILKQKTNLLGTVVNFFTDNAETVLKTDEEGKYQFENVSAGFYELAIYDVEDEKDADKKNLLASAEINVGEKHEEADDLITVASAAEFVTPYQNITGDMFIFDIDRTILSTPAPEAPVVKPPAPEIIPAPEVVENPPIFYMYKEIVLKKKNTFTINLQGIDKSTTVTSKITGKSAKAKKVVSIKQKKNGNVVITPKKLGKTQVTCTVLKNDVVYQVVVNIKVLKQYKGTSKNFNLKSSALMKTTGDLPEFNVYKRIVKGKKTQIKFTKVATNAKVKFYVANKKEKKILKIGKIKRKGSTATCTIRGKKKGWVHLTAKITQNGQTYYTRILVRIDDRSCEKEEISKQIHKYLE